MSLNQVTIEIPLNIQKGLDSGIYKSLNEVQNFLFINQSTKPITEENLESLVLLQLLFISTLKF